MTVRRLVAWIEAAFAAVAFAEEGDAASARRVLAERDGAAPPGRTPAPGTKPQARPARRRLPAPKIARLP